jgi:transcriptional regulator with XRE-family HTH domain
METIHKHQAYAVITWPDEQPTVEVSPAPAISSDTIPFGQWLRERRTVNGESQNSLASSLGLSASLISRVETNEKQLSEESLEKLAGHWGLDPVTVKLQSGSIPKYLVDIIRNNPQSFVDWTSRYTQQ